MKPLKWMLPVFAIILFQFSCQIFRKSLHKTIASAQSGSTSDTAGKKNTSDSAKSKAPRPYKEVITSKAVSSKGMITVHKIEDKYFFEIPFSLLDRDLLVASRISKAATGIRPYYGFLGYAGDLINQNVIQFSKGFGNKIFVKRMSYEEKSTDSSTNGMFRSVRNSNIQPLIASFDIKAFSLDSAAVVLDLTEYLSADNDLFYFSKRTKNVFGLTAMQADRSHIQTISSFPLNVEIITSKTFALKDDGGFGTYELNTSFVLLPDKPMKPRCFDDRVGYFFNQYIDYDEPQRVKVTNMITRWRLEPKPGDVQKYLGGELVEPQKPIVFYIDPTTPKKWIPYLIQGVNDWQKAFEKAGFKNAIYALEAPEKDSTWSLYDARHSAIVYKPSYIPNANGPHINDPRTGEILETHINWYHNVQALLHDWYMVQAGPNDPRARKMEFDDALMGQLIRFVASHEVGHTLGLMHNYGASSTIPVEKLRDKDWVERNGFCPSIMDYARFNYVAQPEDHISEKGIMPRIGVYDEWAIEWGYRWFPEFKSQIEERTFLNNWIIESLNKDKRLYFGNEDNVFDPRRQAEAVGDDAVLASEYGIKNLKRIVPELINWTRQPNGDYTSLFQMNYQVINQFNRYINHVATYVGGRTITKKTVEQPGPVREYVSAQDQKRAIQFLHKHVFETPYWIMNKELAALQSSNGFVDSYKLQTALLERITSHAVMHNLLYFETNQPDQAYTVNQLLTDIEAGIWKELNTSSPVDFYRRNLQKVYTERLINILLLKVELITDYHAAFSMTTDVYSILKNHMQQLINRIAKTLPSCRDEMTRLHYKDIKERLQIALDPLKQRGVRNDLSADPTKPVKSKPVFSSDEYEQSFIQRHRTSCWEDKKLEDQNN